MKIESSLLGLRLLNIYSSLQLFFFFCLCIHVFYSVFDFIGLLRCFPQNYLCFSFSHAWMGEESCSKVSNSTTIRRAAGRY